MMYAMNCVPIFVKENILYNRQEKDGSLTFISKTHPETQHLQMNEISSFIIEQCNGKNTIDGIVDRITKEYKGAQRDKVLQDLMDLLHNLWRMGLVQWKDKNPLTALYNTSVKGYYFSMLTEDETIQRTGKLKGKKYCINPYLNEELAYSELAMRQKVFVFVEEFFALHNGEEDFMLFSIARPLDGKKVASIGYLYINEDFEDVELMREFVRWSIKKFIMFAPMIKDTSRINLYLEAEGNEHLFNKAKSIGFEFVGTLKNELGRDSSDIHVLHLKK